MTTIYISAPTNSIDFYSELSEWVHEFCVGPVTVFHSMDERGYMHTMKFEVDCELESDATLIALKWK